MATVEEMLKIAGTLENAEVLARKFVEDQGPQFLMDLQVILSLQGRFAEAIEVNDSALKLNAADIRAQYNRGWFLMRDGDMRKGFELMNKGRAIETWGNKHIGTDRPIWNGETKQFILVNFEAGFGDQIIFARFIKDITAKGNRVIVCCNPGLSSLFSRVEGVSAVVNHGMDSGVYFDSWVPSMALPVILNYSGEDISGKQYLMATPEHVQKFKEVIKTKRFKVGIAWMGNPKFEHEQFRRFPTDLMFNAVKQEGIKVHSLQIGSAENPPEDVVDLKYLIKSWEDTAGAIENLDLVITSCTAVAHLAGAMGKPAWVVVPVLPYWAWAQPGRQTVWYDSVEVFRQEVFGQWEHPFIKIKEKLGKYE